MSKMLAVGNAVINDWCCTNNIDDDTYRLGASRPITDRRRRCEGKGARN